MIRRLGFQRLAHAEVELFPRGRTVMRKHLGEEAFFDKGLLLILRISSLFSCFVFSSLSGLGLWFQLRSCVLESWDEK